MKTKIYFSNYGKVEAKEVYLIDGEYYTKDNKVFYLREMTKDQDYGYFVDKKDAIQHAINYLRRDIKRETKMLEKLNKTL